MSKKCIVLLCSVLAVVPVVAQRLGNTRFELRHSSMEAYSFTLSVSDIDIIPQGDFATLYGTSAILGCNSIHIEDLPQIRPLRLQNAGKTAFAGAVHAPDNGIGLHFSAS